MGYKVLIEHRFASIITGVSSTFRGYQFEIVTSCVLIYLMLDIVSDPQTEEQLLVLHLVLCSCWAELDGWFVIWTYWRRKREYSELLSREEYRHIDVVHLRSDAEVSKWLGLLGDELDLE